MIARHEDRERPEGRDIARLGALYAEHHAAGHRHDFTVSERARGPLFARWAGQGRRVLDLGCRDGALTRYVVEGNQVLGLDVDRNALAVAATRLGIQTCWTDISLALPVEDASYDCVMAGEVLEHLPSLTLILEEVARVLVPGGLFIGSVPNAYALKNRIDVLRGRDLDRDPSHLQFFSPAKLRRVLAPRFDVLEICSVRGSWAWLSLSLFARHLAWRAVKR